MSDVCEGQCRSRRRWGLVKSPRLRRREMDRRGGVRESPSGEEGPSNGREGVSPSGYIPKVSSLPSFGLPWKTLPPLSKGFGLH